eukprot:2695134-Pyramimonas_sp.AAC.1
MNAVRVPIWTHENKRSTTCPGHFWLKYPAPTPYPTMATTPGTPPDPPPPGTPPYLPPPCSDDGEHRG